MNFLVIGKMKIIGYFVLFALFLTTSCGSETSCDIYKYTVRNESGVDIKIVGYNAFRSGSDSIVFELKNNEEQTEKHKSCPIGGVKYYSFANFFKSDSIKVIFNAGKVSLFTKNINCDINTVNTPRNPLNECFYNGGRNKIETFIFTKEDYENAEDCNGNCE